VIAREEAKPGDLVFFTKTYASSTPVSHVGLYIGGNQMLHCGDVRPAGRK
jgi:peptidoglycan DL-endopeptidase CwlO